MDFTRFVQLIFFPRLKSPRFNLDRHQRRCIRPNQRQPRLRQRATCEGTWSGHRQPWRPRSRRRTAPGWTSRKAPLSGRAECTRTIAVSSRSTLWTAATRATGRHQALSTSLRLTSISEHSVLRDMHEAHRPEYLAARDRISRCRSHQIPERNIGRINV